MNKTIPSIFQSSVEKYKERIAFNYFRDDWKTMTYDDFSLLTNSISSAILEIGIKAGDRIAIISENRPEWCAAYMAILMCGGIAVPIDMQLGSEEIKNLLMDSEAKIVFYSSKTEANVLKAIEKSRIKAINLDASNFVLALGYKLPSISSQPDDIASIIYTSGTTGTPKGVMLMHDNFCSDAEAVIKSGLISHSDNILSILPLHHAYPFMCTFLVPIFLGASVTFAPGLKASDIISTTKDKNITIVVAVPRLLEMIRNGIVSKIKEKKAIFWILSVLIKTIGTIRKWTDINIGKAIFKPVHKNFPSLRFFASGGAKLEPSIMIDLEAMGFTIIEGYGLSETSPIITFNPLKKRKPGSAGRPLPDVQIKINSNGEIMVKGNMVMKGYYKNPKATSEIIKDGWFYTGDTGYIDSEGYLFITGRKKEVIVLSSGKNIYPEDVEKLYGHIPLIKEICVVGIEDSLHAVIVPDFEYAKKALIGNIYETLKWNISEISMKLPEYMRIKGFTLHSEPLPRTPLGKIKRFMVNELAKARPEAIKAKEDDKGLIEDYVGKKVVEGIKSLMKEEVFIRASDNLELDLGFDSLKRIEFISSIESIFSISLPDTFVSEIQTVGDVVLRLKSYIGTKEPKEEISVSWKDMLQKEPSKEDIKKVSFSFNLFELGIVYLIITIMKIIFKLFFRLKIHGKDNIPDKGPFIIAPNHTSYLDGFVIAASVDFKTFKDLYFLGFQKYFVGGIRSWFAKISHVIPIDPDVYMHRALQMSAYMLRNNKTLCIFPEGGRSFDGGLMEFKKGIGVLGIEIDIPVIPACIKGAFAALPRGAVFIRPSKINVSFGKPIRPSEIDINKKPEHIDKYQYLANELRKKVNKLC